MDRMRARVLVVDDDPALAETAELVHNLALLAEGSEPVDPARFVKLVADRLERTL